MFFKPRSKYNWREIFLKYGGGLASLAHHGELYKKILSVLLEVSGAEGASLLLFDAQAEEFVLKEQMGPSPLAYALPGQHPLILWLKRDLRPLTRHQLAEDARYLDLKRTSLAYFSEWNAEVVFPLVTEKKFLGLFNLGPKNQKGYDSDDLELFSTLINFSSFFIENAIFYERLLKQNQKLSDLARLKTQFVNNITHELRTPLHGVLGLADLLISDPEEILTADYRRYLDMLKSSAESLLEQIDHILDLTRYQSDQFQLDIHRFDYQKMVLETLKEYSDQMQLQKTSFEMDWPDSIPPVYGDERELKNLTRDLISNAIKFTPQGNIRISPIKTGDMLKICIQDSGVGIDDAKQHEIFEDFHQEEGEMTREFGGTGLGLSLAKRIVEMHGGRIWVESKKGKGSHFYYTLPLIPHFESFRKKSSD
ncbi:MAG: GAF domain-containing sensor histidine kinase [Deltaproteobacteria bacterium]|nr:GAF domain-containing sensor histidine kinase [Deltaproteobacteria bacterium]